MMLFLQPTLDRAVTGPSWPQVMEAAAMIQTRVRQPASNTYSSEVPANQLAPATQHRRLNS